MLFNVSDEIRHCYERASDYHQRAEGERDPHLREMLRDLEDRWLNLAQSYELTEELSKNEA